jgi:Uma2 family endonuclease
MRLVETNIKFASDEEYFLYEEKSEVKHELINRNLYEMSGESIFHNDIVFNIVFLLKNLLKNTNFRVAFENFKARTPEKNYFYPDVLVCEKDVAKYYSDKSILIVEVLSDATRQYDLSDKFIQYRKIETLRYYLCVEPEQQVVIFFFKNENGEWLSETYTKDEDKIDLKLLDVSFTLKDIYKPGE